MNVKATSAGAGERRQARDVIVAVVNNMRRNLEALRYSTLAPSRYVVYLHPSEYARLEGIVPILQEQTLRALAEEIDRLNRRSRLGRYAERVLGRGEPPVQNAGAWQVEFLPDPDGEMAEGDILVDSELLLPPRPELGVGERTRRVTTAQGSHRVTGRQRVTEGAVTPTTVPVLARIVYEDNAGRHSYDVSKDSVTIGRGGVTYPVDVKIVSSVDVSREHARIRRDSEGRFLLVTSRAVTTRWTVPSARTASKRLFPIRRASGSRRPSFLTSRLFSDDGSSLGALPAACRARRRNRNVRLGGGGTP
jgi:hypothetical protein